MPHFVGIIERAFVGPALRFDPARPTQQTIECLPVVMRFLWAIETQLAANCGAPKGDPIGPV